MFLDKQIEIIKRQLTGLDASQRVALALCAVVVAGSMLWLTQWSLEKELVPLYTQVLREDEITDIARYLTLSGESFEERTGEGIWVSPEDRRRVLMKLVANNAGPKTFTYSFDEMLQGANVFAPEATRQRQYMIALQNELAKTISTMQDIRTATVYIAQESKELRLGYARNKPTATVTVDPIGSERLNPSVVETLVRLVSGAVTRLEPQNVRVVDLKGRFYKVDDPDNAFGGALYDLQRHKEQQLLSKIENILAHIPGVMATVSLKLDEQVSTTLEEKLGEPAIAREMREETESSNRQAGAEPGVGANVSAALLGGSSGTRNTTEKSETEFQSERDRTVTNTRKNPGEIVEAAASILIPRSYLIAAIKSMNGQGDAEPSQQDVEDFRDQETRKIRDLIEPILVAVAEPKIEVDVYFDQAQALVANPLGDPATVQQSTVMTFVNDHSRQIGLIGLALAALGLTARVVKRTGEHAGTPDLGPGMKSGGPVGGELAFGEGAIGDAGTPDAFLIARETDEGSIRARQMAEQVSEMINDDPENAAQLVRRWIERGA